MPPNAESTTGTTSDPASRGGARPAPRTTLSYAVLGLLSLRSMGAYELVQGYARSLGQVMSRSEAAIYAEPKRLEAAGLVTHTDERRGNRIVAVYSITEAGRDELRAWLARPTTFPEVDAEPVLRVVFADSADVEQVRTTVGAFRDQVLTRLFAMRAIADEYRTGTGPYQERAPLVALSGTFVAELMTAYLRWCDRVLAALDEWGTLGPEAVPAAVDAIAAIGDAVTRLTADR